MGAGSIDLSPWDVSIGVNEAVEFAPVDWWSYCDRKVPTKFQPIAKPKGVFTVRGQKFAYKDDPKVAKLSWGDMPIVTPTNWTTIITFNLALYLGITHLDVFGADMKLDEGPLRSKKRWELERLQFDITARGLAERGITIVRHESCDLLTGAESTEPASAD